MTADKEGESSSSSKKGGGQRSDDDEGADAARPSPVLVHPQAIRPGSPPTLLRPKAQRPAFLHSPDSLESLSSSLSFLLHEAAMQEGERRSAKSRQSNASRPHAYAKSHLAEPDDGFRRAKSPWFASEAIDEAEAASASASASGSGSASASSGQRDEKPEPERQHAKSTPPGRIVNRHVEKWSAEEAKTVKRSRSPFKAHLYASRPSSTQPQRFDSRTPIPDHQTADLIAQMHMLRAQDEQQDATVLHRLRKAASLRSPTPAADAVPHRPKSAAPFAFTSIKAKKDEASEEGQEGGAVEEGNDDDEDDGLDHMLLKGDEEDEHILEKTRSRSSSVGTGSSASRSIRTMSDEEQLQAIQEEFGPMQSSENDPTKQQERFVVGQGAVLVRRVLVRGYMVLTTHRLCFLALLPTDPTRHRILQQGPAVIHRPGLTRRKRRAWFTLTADSITAYPSSTELYEPLGGARLVDIDDVQPSPREKSVHFRVKGKKCSLEFETVESAMEWQREIDAALFLYTHHVDKIRISVPLSRIAQTKTSDVLDFARLIIVDVLNVETSQHRHPRLHLHQRAEEHDPSSTTDLLFSVLRSNDKITGRLDEVTKPWSQKRLAMDCKAWHTLPAALIDIDGPRTLAEEREEGKGTNASERKTVIIEQFSLDCEPDEVEVFKVHLVRTLPLAGLLAITPNHLCFYRHHRFTGLADTRIRIPLSDVKAVQEGKAFLWHYHGIRVRVRAHEDLSFELRDEQVRDEIVQKTTEALKREEQEEETEEVELDQKAKQRRKRANKLHSLAAHQQRNVQITLSPDHINLVPRTINVKREDHITLSPMKIHCLTIGSRGDVQPYVALCKRLQQRDHHQCTIVSHPEYREWVEENGLAFREVGGDPGELMKLSVENNKMLFSPQFYREAMGKFRHWLDELLRGIMETCWDAELIIESPSTFGGIHVAEAVGAYYMRAFTMPWTKTSAYPQAFSVPSTDLGPQYNAMSYTMFDQVLWLASSGQINRWRRHMLHLEPTDLAKLNQQSVPFMYNFSPAVVPPPLDWGDRIKVTGYWTLSNDSKKWDPPEDLLEFIKKARSDEKKLCYIGFGSITMNDPIDVQRNIYEAVQKADVRAIVSKGWSARMIEKKKSEGKNVELHVPDEVYSVDSIPHDWLFPRIDVAMHHGGAGTTGASLNAGLVTLIHPFFGDQYFWSGRVAKLGAGLRVKSLQVDDLTDALTRARDQRLLREKAEQVGEKIRRERGVEEAIAFIYHNLNRAKRTKHPLGSSASSSSTSNALRRSSSYSRQRSELSTLEGAQVPSEGGGGGGGVKPKAAFTPLSSTTDEAKGEEDQHRFSMSSLWSANSIKSALPTDLLRRSGSAKGKSSKEMRKSDSSQKGISTPPRSGRTSKESSRKTESTEQKLSSEAVVDHQAAGLEVKRTESPSNMTEEAEAGAVVEEAHEENVERRRSWYSSALHVGMPSMHTLSMPSLSMPHMNFFDVRLHGLHLTHRDHAEAAASAKETMTEEERAYAQKEDKKRHISAKQEDQRRRQLLESEWRKAKRFDLLDNDQRLDVQPEEEEDDDEQGQTDEGEASGSTATTTQREDESSGESAATAPGHDGGRSAEETKKSSITTIPIPKPDDDHVYS